MSVGFFLDVEKQKKQRAAERAERHAKAARLPQLDAYEAQVQHEIEVKKADEVAQMSLAEVMDIIGHNCPFCEFRAQSSSGLSAHVRARHKDGIKHSLEED